MKTNTIILTITTTLLCLSAQAGKMDPSTLPPASTKEGLTFDKDIKPILQQSCAECHGARKAKARLNLESLAGVQKGSEEGAVIVANHSDKSKLLYITIPAGKKGPAMPPSGKGKPLTTEQVGLIRAWIDQGAK